MTKLIKYFHPNEENSFFNELKTKFFIRICFFGILFLAILLLTDSVFNNENFLVSFSSKFVMLVCLFVFLFVLKHKGIKLTGNIFSILMLVFLLIFINIIPEGISPISKFIQGFYSVFAFILMAMLYANKLILIINSILILASSTHVYIKAISLFPDQSNLYTSSYINHTAVLIIITVIAFYFKKFTELTIKKANDELAKQEIQNQELLASEEEIRASNEELVATTDALVEANEELTYAKERAEESDRLKTQFLNNMSHEVRTPMNGIIGFSQLLDIPDLDEKSRKFYINTIQQSSNQLLSIIDNIIEISKLGTKQVKVFENEIILNAFLSELQAVFKIEANKKGIDFELKCDLPDSECKIFIDEIKLYKVLSNLLENAMKFTEKGFVEFGYRIIQQDLGLGSDKAIQFYIKDTGIGIELEKQKVIFEKFSQAEGELSRQFGGLGLGLSIAKENTKLMKGTICLNSERGKGSEFIVTVPLKTA